MNDATQSRPVLHRLCDQSLSQFRRRRDPEEIDRHRVEPAASEAAEYGVTNACLAGPARACDHHARAPREYGGDLSHVCRSANHLTGRDWLIGRKEVGTSLPAHAPTEYMRRPRRIMRR